MADNLPKLCKKAAEIILSVQKTTRIRVVSHYDADGITAAAIICKALHRAGYDFHATLMRNPFDKGLERISKEENKLIIFSDMGSGQIETIEKIGTKAIIVDHHQYLKKHVKDDILQINANLCGINGNYESCAATLVYSVAKAIDSDNNDLIPLALTGVIGDKQYIGGIRGYNKNILDEALKNDHVQEIIDIKLYGDTLFDTLYYSIEPYYSGLSGNQNGINNLVKKLELKKDAILENIVEEKKKQLKSFLMLKLIKNGCDKKILDTIIRKRYISELIGCELERLADLLDACGKGGNRSLGLSICLGDKNSFNEALEFEKQYKQRILDELLRLEKEGFQEKNCFRYFYSIDSSLGGVIGGIATNYLLDNQKPLLSLVKKNDELHISCRGNQYLVGKGLDLGIAMKEAAIKLGGHGGGHSIAAGATIDFGKEKEFLTMIDGIISRQFNR